MVDNATSLYRPRLVPNMQYWAKDARNRTKTEWRRQHANTLILTVLYKFNKKYSEVHVPVCVKVVADSSVTLSETQSKEIFDLLAAWLHPPGDIALASKTRRDIQSACIEKALDKDHPRPYKVTCL